MIVCKKCGHEGPYEGQLCPQCQTRYTLTQNEVRILLEETHGARARREMETVTENYRMLADFGVTEAEREHGRHLEEEGRWEEAAVLYRRAAIAGDATGAYRFALCNPELDERARRFWLCYASVLGAKESYFPTAETLSHAGDERMATYFYALAAECDDTGALVMLAKRYAEGEGCEKNEGYAKWYLDRFTIPPMHALTLAFRLRNVEAQEPPMPEHDRYGEFLKSLRRDAQRYGFFGAEKYLAELLMGKGDVEATMRVAEIYLKEAETEDAVKQQRAQKNVISALQLASVGGSADAYMMLGDFYRYGKCGLVKNEKEAMAAYAKAAELSSGDAYLVLAEMHLDDAYGKKNIPLAIRLLEEGAKCGSDEAFRRASMLKDEREAAYRRGVSRFTSDPEGAMRDFATSVSMGYLPAQVKLADCYLKGVVTRGKPDKKTAYRWYKSAYELGVDEAITPLAFCYSRGVGVAFDNRRAISLLKKGIALGDARCKKELDRLCKNRLQKSIRSLNSQASRLLYAHKFDEAFRILQALAKMDEAEAIYFLGACYEFGIGTKVDRPLAYEMYRKAADLGFSDERSTRKAIFLKLVK